MVWLKKRLDEIREVFIMKNLTKVLSAAAAMTILAAAAGCGQALTDNSASTGEKTYKIDVLQYADHPSLDNCYEGFKEGLTSEGIKYEITAQSAKNDDATNTQIAQNFAADKPDLVCGIATPSAQALYTACAEKKIPVVFNAVSDPVAAKLAKSETEALDGITGVSDKLPVEAQLKLIREIMPDAKKIGILYTTSEANSVSTVETYKEKADSFGFEIVEKGITNAADIAAATDVLVQNVDCITNMTDNTVVANLPTLLEKATAKNIPVFGSEEEQVANGCVASAGIDYVELGKKAGVIAAKVLNGTDIATIPYETMTESKVTINKAAAEKINLELPTSVTDRAEVTGE